MTTFEASFFEAPDFCIFQLDTKDQALDELESRAAYIQQSNVSESPHETGHQKPFETGAGNQTSLTQSEREAFEAMKQQVLYVSVMIPESKFESRAANQLNKIELL